eukprot:GHRR01024516.1.p1 GENE.GHRR01024516.1~~GHRR01024516.1.p1  ORF type:complete len:122 (-),score=20.53 GHRR01024516.1:505-870(-)
MALLHDKLERWHVITVKPVVQLAQVPRLKTAAATTGRNCWQPDCFLSPARSFCIGLSTLAYETGGRSMQNPCWSAAYGAPACQEAQHQRDTLTQTSLIEKRLQHLLSLLCALYAEWCLLDC